MRRIALGGLAILFCTTSNAVLSADYPPLRPAFPQQWEAPEADPLRVEFGVRYWYSLGRQEHAVGTDRETMDTKTHSGEVFVHVEDALTRSYAEAFAGYGVAHDGSYAVNGGAETALPAARLGYAGIDYAWLPLGSEEASFGMVTGYQYTNDSPDTGRVNFSNARTAADATDTGAGWTIANNDSKVNNFEVHSVKLGLAGKFDAGSFDILGEAAAIPYSWVTGTYGAYAAQVSTPTSRQGSPTKINGHAYGATGKLMVGFRPTENLAIRVGGRASYLTGQYDATWDNVTVQDPVGGATTPSVSRRSYIVNNNPFSMLRYGALLEVAGRF